MEYTNEQRWILWELVGEHAQKPGLQMAWLRQIEREAHAVGVKVNSYEERWITSCWEYLERLADLAVG